MFTRLGYLCIASTICLFVAAAAGAAPINYGDFNGTNVGDATFLQVTEDSGTDPTPLFGAPIHVPNRLLFFPTTFASSSAGGSSDATVGILTMRVQADSGFFLDTIAIDELTDYTLSGVGTSDTMADIGGVLEVTDVSPGSNGTLSDSLTFAPTPPFTLPPPIFEHVSGAVIIDLAGMSITELDLVFANALETISEASTAAFIQKKTITIEATSVPVPEPATALMVSMSLLGLIRRRR